MLPLAHTYVSSKVTKRTDPLLLFGSVLPDICTTSAGNLGRDEIHNAPEEFYSFIKDKYPSLLDLGLGVLLHSNISKGADYYSDDYEIGYAIQNGKLINNEVAGLLGTEPDKVSLVLSHNFIEGAVDLLLVENQSEIAGIYKEAQDKINPKLISPPLAEYLKHDKGEIVRELEYFKFFLSYEHLISKYALVDGIAIPLVKQRMNKEINREKAIRIFEKAKDLIKETYLNYLDNTVKEMKITFAPYL